MVGSCVLYSMSCCAPDASARVCGAVCADRQRVHGGRGGRARLSLSAEAASQPACACVRCDTPHVRPTWVMARPTTVSCARVWVGSDRLVRLSFFLCPTISTEISVSRRAAARSIRTGDTPLRSARTDLRSGLASSLLQRHRSSAIRELSHARVQRQERHFELRVGLCKLRVGRHRDRERACQALA